MFDHEKMSEKDQERYAEEMSAEIERAKQAEKQASTGFVDPKRVTVSDDRYRVTGIADKQADTDFPPNCGAPLDSEAATEGRTWCSVQRKYVTHQSLGATVTKLKPGWRHLVGLHKRYYFKPGLKVVSIVYWPEDVDRKGVK